MAILFMDGFDHYKEAETSVSFGLSMLGNYSANLSSNGFHNAIETMPVLGGSAVRFESAHQNQDSNNGRLTHTFPSPKTTGWIAVGFHIYITSIDGDGDVGRFFSFGDGSTTTRSCFNMNANGNWTVRSGLSTLEGTSPLSYFTDTLYHVEFRHTFGNPGMLELRVDGQTVISEEATLTDPITDFKLCVKSGNFQAGHQYFIDNLYVCDDTGTVNNDWMGERNIYTLRPDADTAPQDWTLSGGSDAYALLNQTPPDPLNDFIESVSVDDISQFTVDDLASVDILVSAVSVHTQAEKTGTSDTTLDVGVSSNSATDSVTHTLVQDQALWNSSVFEVNPDTGEQWLPAEVNSLEVFVERSL